MADRDDVDRGWAWVALASSVGVGALLAAFGSSIGLFQVQFLDSFQGSQGFVALICSLCLSSQFLYGPLAGLVCDRVTHRVAVMAGSGLLATGLLGASFCQSLPSLLLVFGLLGGLGAGLCYSPGITVVSIYFRRYRTLANGLCLSAPGLGTLISPYLAQWLIQAHGWRLAMACYSCLMAQMCIMAALFFPPHAAESSSTASCCARVQRPTQKPPPEQNSGFPDDDVTGAGKPGIQNGGPKTEVKMEMGDNVGVGVGEWGSRGGQLRVSEMGSLVMSHWSLALSVVDVEEIRTESFRERVKRMLSQKFLWVMCLIELLMDAGYSIHMILFPAYAHSVGLPLMDIPPLYIVYGVTLTVTRILGGVAFSFIYEHWLKAFFAFLVAYSLVLLLLPLYGGSFSSLMVCQFLVGATYGPCYSLLAPIMVKYLGLRDLPLAFGITMLASGIGSTAGAPIAGFLYDITGNYGVCFYVAGGLIGAAALAQLLLLCIPNLQPFPEECVPKDTHGLSSNQKEPLVHPANQKDPLVQANGSVCKNWNSKSKPMEVQDTRRGDLVYEIHDEDAIRKLFEDGPG